MNKEVRILSFRATNFGVFKAVELDFEKFKSGVISIKGRSGEGKSTFQKGCWCTNSYLPRYLSGPIRASPSEKNPT